jgi:hypothetical protein
VTAVASPGRARKTKAFKYIDLTLSSGKIGYVGARAAFDLGGGEVVPMAGETGLLGIGFFAETKDASAAAKTVSVCLDREVEAEWFANDTGTAVVAADVGGLCWFLDDATVTGAPAAASDAGRVWAVDSTKGVLVEKIELARPLLAQPAAGSFTAGDYAPTTVEHGAVYDVPTTAANSTLTLPAAALNGTEIWFAADGTKNGHTVQYRDATGPTNLTTALTASKRHLVACVKRGGKWFANAYVSP